MTVRELFDFITDPSINQDNLDQYLEKVSGLPLRRTLTGYSFLIGCPGDGRGGREDVGAAFQSGPRGRGGDENVLQTEARQAWEVASPVPAPPPQVFKKAYIPRTLTEVSHYERDVDMMKEEESAISGHNDNVRNP